MRQASRSRHVYDRTEYFLMLASPMDIRMGQYFSDDDDSPTTSTNAKRDELDFSEAPMIVASKLNGPAI